MSQLLICIGLFDAIGTVKSQIRHPNLEPIFVIQARSLVKYGCMPFEARIGLRISSLNFWRSHRIGGTQRSLQSPYGKQRLGRMLRQFGMELMWYMKDVDKIRDIRWDGVCLDCGIWYRLIIIGVLVLGENLDSFRCNW